MEKARQVLSKIANLGWYESGFLLGIFFAPWGPVPRYLGWLLSIGTWAFSRTERKRTEGSLPPHFRWALAAFILWAFFVTGLSGANLHDFVKGASNPVETAFAMWLAASVLRRPGATRRCAFVLWAATVLTGSWTIARYAAAALAIVPEYLPGPFSNINTLGGYAFPLCAFWFAMTVSAPKTRERAEALSGLVFSLSMLFLSFSTLPWLATLTAFAASSILLRTEGESLRPALRGVAIAMAVIALLLAFPGKPIARAALLRETAQMTAVDDTAVFTNHRLDFVRGTILLIRQKPITGWGWGRFESIFPGAQRELGLPPENPGSPHNLYLGLLCESGAIGLAVFFGIVLSIFSAAWKSRRGNRKGLAIAILSVILAYGGIFSRRKRVRCQKGHRLHHLVFPRLRVDLAGPAGAGCSGVNT